MLIVLAILSKRMAMGNVLFSNLLLYISFLQLSKRISVMLRFILCVIEIGVVCALAEPAEGPDNEGSAEGPELEGPA